MLTPFLPGDLLVFTTGALAAAGSIKVLPIYLIFCVAAIAGDTLNYAIGHFFGYKVSAHENMRFIKREYLERTNKFFKKHGGKTIIIARFVPIIRTFAPFVAGVGIMPYGEFALFNVAGGISWVTIALFSGYFFGNLTFVKDNLSLVILGIIAVSLIPVVITLIKNELAINER